MEKKIAEIIATCEKYGFMERTVMPYSFVMTVRQLVEPWKDYKSYTKSSQSLMRAEIRGFEEILKEWVKVAQEPVVVVRWLTGENVGNTHECHQSVAQCFIDCGIAELV